MRIHAEEQRAIGFLRAHRDGQPKLADLAAHIGLSSSHTQRLFSRWAGISPKRFLQFVSVEHAKQRMGQTGDLLGLALEAIPEYLSLLCYFLLFCCHCLFVIKSESIGRKVTSLAN